MNDSKNEVWITGVGVISCFGEGIAPHWETLGAETAPEPVIDAERFAPYARRADASPYLLTLVGRAYEALGERALAARQDFRPPR